MTQRGRSNSEKATDLLGRYRRLRKSARALGRWDDEGERRAWVVEQRDAGASLDEIGWILDVTKERVRQLELMQRKGRPLERTR